MRSYISIEWLEWSKWLLIPSETAFKTERFNCIF